MRFHVVICLVVLASSIGCGSQSASKGDPSAQATSEPNSEQSIATDAPTASFHVGMPKQDVLATLEKLDAIDITSGATYTNVDTGEHVMAGIVYSLPHHDTTLTVHYDAAERLASLVHCNGDNYGVSKQHRAESEVDCDRIAYNSDGSWSYTATPENPG